MRIRVDTREHLNSFKRIEEQVSPIDGAALYRRKLDIGDYACDEFPQLVIERKGSLFEVSQNVTRGHRQFREEFQYARALGLKVVLLIEESLQFQNLEDVKIWTNPYPDLSPVNGPQLLKSLKIIESRYGVDIRFCRKDETGLVIYRIFKEALKNGKKG